VSRLRLDRLEGGRDREKKIGRTVGGSSSRRRIDPGEAKLAPPAERAAEPDEAHAGDPTLTQSRRSPMELCKDETRGPEEAPEARRDEPKLRRFRIVKLEERIAPVSFDVDGTRSANSYHIASCH
jgi:hypothetical protein